MKYFSKTKILSTALALILTISTVPAKAYTDVYETDIYSEAVNRLGDLDIINGFEDGSFRPYDTLTRAQFAKLVVCALDKEDEAKASAVSSNFNDVNQYYWAVPYINYVSKNNIIIGYADGTYAPEKPITYAEAVTVLVRALGYSESDIGYFWPQNYIDKAVSLGVSDYVFANSSDVITRGQAALLLDNMLFTDINLHENGKSDATFLETIGYTVLEDNVVVGTEENDENLNSNEIKLSDDTIYKHYTMQHFEPASVVKYLVIDDGDIVAAKGFYTGDSANAEMKELGYTVLTNCHIIASSSDDKTLSAGEIRTSQGVYKSNNNDVSSKVGEYGTVLLDKNRNIISVSTKETPYTEYIVAEVADDNIKYVSGNSVQSLALSSDFPIYTDFESKKSFSSAKDDFVAGAKLTIYSEDNSDGRYGVLETNSGYSVVTDSFIIADKNDDTSLSADEVVTSSGTYKVKNTNILSMVGAMGIMVLNKDNRIEQFAPAETTRLNITVNSLTDNTLEYIGENGSKGTYKFENTFAVYSDYKKSNFASTRNEITSGTDMTFYGESFGNWNFAVINSTADIDPVLVTKDYSEGDLTVGGLYINNSGLTVYREGKSAKLTDIKKNDVVYYNTKTNVMDVYNKKVTGIYYDALPNKAYVSSVKVGGGSYEIATTDALAKLDASYGSYEIGDRVTLLLGKNDKVVFAVDLTNDAMYDYGVVLKTYTEIVDSGDNKGKSEIKADVFMPDGSTLTYVTDKDYDECIGKLVRLSFDNGVLKCAIQSANKISGKIDKSSRTIGGKTLLKNAAIIQLNNCVDNENAEVELLDFDTLDVSEVNSGQVINTVTANAFDDIMILYVENVSLTSYDYGMLTSMSDSSYKILIDGEVKTFDKSRSFAVKADIPVAVKCSGGSIEDIFNMYLYESAYSISAIDGSRIKLNGKIYQLAGDAVYYSIDSNGKYSTLSYNEIENAQTSSVSIYSDVSASRNGTVKAVVVRLK